jgi:hypothetical protein
MEGQFSVPEDFDMMGRTQIDRLFGLDKGEVAARYRHNFCGPRYFGAITRSTGTGRQYPRFQCRQSLGGAIKHSLVREDFRVDPKLLWD